MKNPISRIVGSGLILMVIFAILGSLLIRSAINTYNEKKAGINKAIGAEIVLNGDTLMVLDYDWWGSHYILNDGTQISTVLLDDLEVLPDMIKYEKGKEESSETEGDREHYDWLYRWQQEE